MERPLPKTHADTFAFSGTRKGGVPATGMRDAATTYAASYPWPDVHQAPVPSGTNPLPPADDVGPSVRQRVRELMNRKYKNSTDAYLEYSGISSGAGLKSAGAQRLHARAWHAGLVMEGLIHLQYHDLLAWIVDTRAHIAALPPLSRLAIASAADVMDGQQGTADADALASEWVPFPLFAIMATGDVDAVLGTAGAVVPEVSGHHLPIHASVTALQLDGAACSTTVVDPATATCATARTTAALAGASSDHARRDSGVAPTAPGGQTLHNDLQIPIQHLS